MEGFDVPVVLFMFRRIDTLLKIIEHVRAIKPSKIYLMSDNGRNQSEQIEVEVCRRKAEKAIDWPCKVIKNYATKNRGIYANIALGAKWVFEREKWAIFLEDDNLPELTFFDYCRELLIKYENDTRIFWICGTNYLGKYYPKNGASYMFTRHLLPCGWASWSHKFIKYYDFDLELADDSYIMSNYRSSYFSKQLYLQQYESIMSEKRNRDSGIRFASWDYHMALTIRANGFLGISPAFNQIKNIGVDAYSIHGGTNMKNVMTKRFCGMNSYKLPFPMKHPKAVEIDITYEKKISKIILLPITLRIKAKIVKLLKIILRVPQHESLSGSLNNKIQKKDK